MPKLPSVSPKKFIRIITKIGFYLYSRRRGSHMIFAHPDGRKVIVAMHARDIPKGTLHAMIKDLNLSVEYFRELM